MLILLPNSPKLALRYHVSPDEVGFLLTPSATRTTQVDLMKPFRWAMDNEMFASWAYGKPFDINRWQAGLDRILEAHGKDRCLFVVVPDCPADAPKTIGRWYQYSDIVKKRGVPAAFAIQDGLASIPDGIDYDVMFVGGTDNFRRTKQCRKLIREAKLSGKWVHVGRINTPRGFEWAYKMQTNSVDGTATSKKPDNIQKLLTVVRALDNQMVLI